MTDFGPPPSDGPPPPPRPPMPAPPPPPGMIVPPPGYVAYGGAGAAMPGAMQRVGGLAKAIDILLIILVPLQVIAVFALFQVRDDAQDFLDGRISESEYSDAASGNLSGLSGLLIIPIAVLTIIVMYRMASNLRALGRPNATWGPGWAIGGWFCPPCAVYAIPWLMFRELWKGSDASLAPNDPTWKQRPVSNLVNVWWVLYGLVPVLGFFLAANVAVSAFTDPDWENLAQDTVDRHVFTVGLSVVSIVTTVIYLLMMRQLAARHMQATHER